MAKLELQRRRRLRRRWLWLLVPALLLALIVTAIVVGVNRFKEAKMLEERGHVDDHVATITFVGDITIDDALTEDALQSDGSYDFLPMFLEVASFLDDADLTVGNLELTFAGTPYGSAYYSAPDSLATTLRTLGFDILQTSNSKSIADGISGMESTISTVMANGMDPVGTWVSQSDHDNNRVLIKEVNGIRIAFIALTKGFDGMSLPAGREYLADVLYTDYDDMYENVNISVIQSAVEAAKAENPDLIVALVHWGSAYKLDASATQTTILDTLISSGVDAVIGTHSHVVGEMYFKTADEGTDSERQVFVASSLGNFIASDTTAYTRDGVILTLTVSKDDLTGETVITGAEYEPFYIYDFGEERNDRYKLLDLYDALDEYEDSTSFYRVSDAGYTRLQTALTDLAANTQSDFARQRPGTSEETAGDTGETADGDESTDSGENADTAEGAEDTESTEDTETGESTGTSAATTTATD